MNKAKRNKAVLRAARMPVVTQTEAERHKLCAVIELIINQGKKVSKKEVGRVIGNLRSPDPNVRAFDKAFTIEDQTNTTK